MAQVNIVQYAEVVIPGSRVLRIGSTTSPSTITLTGTGEVIHKILNDVPVTTVTEIYAENLTGIVWWGVKCSVAATLGFGTADEFAAGANAVGLTANVWQFFGSGDTTSNSSNLALRTADSLVDVGNIKIYIPGATVGDVEFIAVY